MKSIFVDFEKTTGKIKPMHAVNNGPAYKFGADQRITNIDAFREAGIPYARNHDASFYSTYGGEHTVDVNNIFTNFDADPYDPASYDFAMTDEYLRVIDFAGVKTFYRLGSKIEHGVKKYNTLPPKDFKKWAVICEHIIKHYNYGWADGFNYGIEYWEIWNEPDLDEDDSPNKRTWGGTKKQFFELYDITAKHLKSCFPELKIGGPALASRLDWAEDFIKQLDAPLDFFSWHIYTEVPEKVVERACFVRELLNKYGYKDTESILNEWNYVIGWENEDFVYSVKNLKKLKGAAFIASTMASCQKTDLDMLMYYDARPSAWNGLFNTDFVCEKLKGYYPFLMFNELYKLGTEAESKSDCDNIYVLAAKDNSASATMITYFNNDDNAPDEEVELNLSNLPGGKEVEIYLLDEDNDCVVIKKDSVVDNNYKTVLKMPLNSSVLVKIK